MNKKAHFILPTALELIAYSVAALSMLLIFNASKLLSFFSNSEELEASTIRFDNLVKVYLDSSQNSILAKLSTGVFWMLVGIGIYVIGWGIYVLIHAFKNDIKVADAFVHPSSAARNEYWHTTTLKYLVRVGAIAGLVVWIPIIFVTILPYSSKAFYDLATHITSISLLLKGLLSLEILAISLYVVVLLGRLSMLRKRVF